MITETRKRKVELIRWIAVYLIDRRDTSKLVGSPDECCSYWEGAEDMAASLLSTIVGEAMADVKAVMNIGDDTLYAEVCSRLEPLIKEQE